MIASSRRIALALLVVATPLPARAEAPSAPPSAPSAPPTAAQLEAARALFHEARELHKQGKLSEALQRALEAYETARTPVTGIEAGNLLVEAGRLVEARDVMRGIALLPATPRESRKGRDARQEAVTIAASLDARIPKIAVAGRPPGVDVLLDGKALPPSDAAAWQGVDPGAHAIVVRAGDRACTTITVSVVEREARTIDLHDVAASCRAEPPPPSAAESAPAPSAVAPPAAARATYAAPPPMMTTTTTMTMTTTSEDDAASRAWRWAGVGIAGAGALAIGVGGVLALGAKADYDAVATQCPPAGCTLDAFDARQSARARADAAGAIMIVGAAAVAGGALVFVLGGARHRDGARVTVSGARASLLVPFR